MSNERKKQLKRDAHKRKREEKRKEVARQAARAAAERSPTALIAKAIAAPIQSAWVPADWDEVSNVPNLVPVVITRALPGGKVLMASALVDRTCLGIKDSMVKAPLGRLELEELLRGLVGPDARSVEPLVAQSIVYHALDYADRLGFSPPRDFVEPLFGPRPVELLDTPLSNLPKPFYIAGPRDNVSRILEQIKSVRGADEFDFFAPA